jgi:hypothetical protein
MKIKIELHKEKPVSISREKKRDQKFVSQLVEELQERQKEIKPSVFRKFSIKAVKQ